LGNLYRLQGQLPEARACLKEAVELCEQYEVRTHYWALMNHLGLVARLSAEHEEALTYCQQVLSEQNAAASERAEALNVMGLVVYDRRQWEEALSYFDQALGLYRSLGDSYQIARILNNRGLVLLRDGNWDKAQESYQEAIEQFRVSDDQAESFKAVMNLGNVFLMKEEYKAAIEQYQQALPIFQQCNYLVDLAYIYNNLGLASTGLTDWEVAEAYFLAALESWRNLGGDAYNQANVLDNLGDMFIKANQLENANEVLRQALQLLGAIPDSPARTYLQGEIEGRLTKLKDSL
jgi:tetratricopeptide (TPR) repeat protein